MEAVILTLALNSGVWAAPANPPQTSTQSMTAQQQALDDLSQKEQSELKKISDQNRDQVRAMHRKYRQERSKVIERNLPGSAARMNHIYDLYDQRNDAIQALDAQEKAEMQALPKPVKPKDRKAVYDKYNTQKSTLREEYNKKIQALQPAHPTTPAAQPAAAPQHHQ